MERSCAEVWRSRYGVGVDCQYSPSGFEVVFGRTSIANERVSLEIGEEDGDYVWFHTDDGIPGAHVVVRAHYSVVTDADILFAAQIAVMFSQVWEVGKHRKAPVMYCRTRQINKAKGYGPGEVYILGDIHTLEVELATGVEAGLAPYPYGVYPGHHQFLG